MKNIVLLSLTPLPILALSNAQDSISQDYETKKLDRVVTTGSAMQSDIANILGNTTIIDSAMINASPNLKLTDIISKSTGVHINNNTSFNPRPKVKIRGINYGTLILLDGVILSDLEGEARILNQIFLDEVERVEIARGASSAIYGTGAIGGAINFITSMPKQLEIKANAGYGSAFIDGEADRNVASGYLSVGNAFFKKRLKLKIHGGFKRMESYANTPAYISSISQDLSGYYQDNKGKYILGTTGEREVNIYDVGIKASYELGERDEISATLRYSNHNYNTHNYKSYLTNGSGNPPYYDKISSFIASGATGLGTYTHILGNLSYLHSFDNGVLRVQASSLNLLSKWQNASSSDADKNNISLNGGAGRGQDIDTTNNYVDIIYEDLHFDRQKFTIGGQLRYHKISYADPSLSNWRDFSTRNGYLAKYGGESFVASLYGSLNSLWVDSSKYGVFGSTLGARFDSWLDYNGYVENKASPTDNRTNMTNYIPIFSPNLALHYTPLDTFGHSHSPQNLTFKTSVGYGFRVATAREKFRFNSNTQNCQEDSHSGCLASNPELKHEQAISFEIGAEYTSKWINTSLYFFNIEMFDMIYQAGNGKQNNPRVNKNAGRARIKGIEYALEIPIWRSLNIQANYTLTNTQILKNANTAIEGKQVPAIPRDSINVSLNYTPKYGFYGSLFAHYKSRFFADDMNSHIWHAYETYDEQFSLNAKLGFKFANGIDITAQFLNMTNNRYYDYYIVPGASFYVQVGYRL